MTTQSRRPGHADIKTAQHATLIGFLATLGWACYGVLIVATDKTPSMLALAIFFSAAAITLVGRRLLLGHGVIDLLRIPAPTLALGFFGLFGNNLLFVLAFTSGANPVSVNIVAFSWPVMMVAIVLIVGLARATWWDALAMGLGTAGFIAISYDGSQLSLHPGLLLALAGALLWALYSALRRLVPDGVPDAMTAFVALSAVASWFGVLVMGEPLQSSLDDVLALVVVGILPVGLANLMWDYGTRLGDPVLLAGLSFLEPLLASSLVSFFHGIPFRAADMAGLVLILLGIGCSVASERLRRRWLAVEDAGRS
ncbi:MAG: DMT family transporter [Hyphomicrobiaceae bacterium]